MRPASTAFAATLLLAGCGTLPPQGRTPYAPTQAMMSVLSERAAMNAKERSDLGVAEARDVPELTDAAHAIPNVAGLPADAIDVEQFNQLTGSGAAGPIGATLYRPKLAKNTPVIILFPGGTWVTRRDAATDETARQLVERTGWVVVTLQPRLAPEATFPAIHDDAMAAYQWARANLRAWGADPTRVVLAGEGPGANLALSTALAARDAAAAGRPIALPDYLLLITPWAGTSTSTASMSENADSRPLTRSTVRWAQRLYASGHLEDPRIDLARRTDFAGLPPVTLVLADIDPLRSGAEDLAERMRAARVPTDLRRYPGVTYGFFGLGAYVPEAAAAEQDVATTLKIALPDPVPLAPAPARAGPEVARPPVMSNTPPVLNEHSSVASQQASAAISST